MNRVAETVLIFVMCAMAATGTAEWIQVTPGVSPSGETRVIDHGGATIRLSLSFGGYEAEEIIVNGLACVEINVPDMALILNRGEPALPIWTNSLIIPDQGDPSFTVIESSWMEFPSAPVVPSKGNLYRDVNPDTVPYVFGEIYSRDSWYPSVPVSLTEPFILRDYRALTMIVHPIQYNARRGIVRVCNSMTVDVTISGTEGHNQYRSEKKEMTREFQSIYRKVLLNLDQRGRTISERAGRMLIIAADQFYDDMNDFVIWKREKGIDSKMVRYSEIGGIGADAVKEFIQAEYDGPGVTFILLVGDKEHIPPLIYQSWGEADPMFALLDGDDVYPDAYVSRFSVQTSSDVETMVARSVEYERTPLIGGAWYHKACGIASNSDGGVGGPVDWEWVDGFREKLLSYSYTEMDQIYAPEATASQVTDALNDGRSLVIYMGHGSPSGWTTSGFSISHIDTLTNSWRLPIVSCAACSNGDFEYPTCFGEAWLRATHEGQPTGGIACYASSVGQSWVPPQYSQQGMVDSLVNDRYNTVGGVLFMGSVAMLEHYGGGVEAEEMFDTWIVFGDCSLQLRTDTPSGMNVIHPSGITIGAEVVTISVPGVPAALVAISSDGVFNGSAYTDASGNASITLVEPFDTPGVAKLTVTAYNRLPYITPLPVSDGDFEPPTVPAGVSLAPDGTLSWNPSTDNIGVETYRIYRANAPYFLIYGRTPLAETASTQYQSPESVGDPEINYYFRITAVDEANNESTASMTIGEHDYFIEH